MTPRSGELATLGLLERGSLRVDIVERETGVGDRDTVAIEMNAQSPCYGKRSVVEGWRVTRPRVK